MADLDQATDKQLEELLQELRVSLPGVQILLAFLLVVPFNSGFEQLDEGDHGIFLFAVLCAAAATALLIAPSAHHRFAWPLGPRGLRFLVRLGTMEARAGLVLLGLSIASSLYLVGKLVLGPAIGGAVAVGCIVLLAVTWVIVPLAARRLDR